MFRWKKAVPNAPKENSVLSDLLRFPGGAIPSGLYDLEIDSQTGHSWRWSKGPETIFSLGSSSQESAVKFTLASQIPDLKISVRIDGKLIGEFQINSQLEKITSVLRVPASNSSRVLSFRYSAWNERGTDYPQDSRQMSVAFTAVRAGPPAYFETKICPHPFSQMDIPAYGPFVPCCYTWLTDEYYALEPREYYANLQGKHDAWSGPGATALRKAVLAGDYRYCRRDICQAKLYSLDEIEEMRERKEPLYPPISERNIAAMAEGVEFLAEGPAYASITGDPRCNLACPSCRKEKITKLTPYAEGLLKKTDESLARFASTIEVMKMSADGEVFFSSYLRELLKSAGDKSRFPRLREVDLVTNGILFNQKTFDELRPGTELIRRVAVSVDAGTKEVYAEVRGGDWDRLWENLRWVGEKRRKGEFKDFALRFVVRKANFRTMREFVRLAEEVGADCIDFSQFVQWNGMAVEHYEQEAVHLPEHPHRTELTELKQDLLKNAKIRLDMNF
ncbi:MAG: radical SAM protein [Bacteriovoracia bacterium]